MILSIRRKRAEAGLRELNAKLEQRVLARADQIVTLPEESRKTIEFPDLADGLEGIADTAVNLIRVTFRRNHCPECHPNQKDLRRLAEVLLRRGSIDGAF